MKHSSMTRRSFLFSTTATAFLVMIPGCGFGGNRLGERERRALARMAHLLYPHDALLDEIYAEVLEPLRQRAADDPALAAALREGLEQLDQLAGRDWRTVPAADQVEALRRIENRPFFATVQNAVREQLYENPEVWRLIGYEGSSVQHGGYIHRGFDDIDWLPET